MAIQPRSKSARAAVTFLLSRESMNQVCLRVGADVSNVRKWLTDNVCSSGLWPSLSSDMRIAATGDTSQLESWEPELPPDVYGLFCKEAAIRYAGTKGRADFATGERERTKSALARIKVCVLSGDEREAMDVLADLLRTCPRDSWPGISQIKESISDC